MIESDHLPVERVSRKERLRLWLENRLKSLGEIAVVLLALATVATFFARWNHIAELLTHFRMQYIVGAMGAVIILAVLRQRGLAALAVLLLLVHSWQVLPRYFGGHSSAKNTTTYSAVVANVFGDHSSAQQLIEYLQQQHPDIVVLLELTPNMSQEMQQLHSLYPHRVARPREDSFGVGLYSRMPISETAVQVSRTTQIDSIAVTVSLAEAGQGIEEGIDYASKIRVIAAHPPPPGSASQTRARNADLDEIAKLATDSDQPVLLLGDLNTTPWSPAFKDLLHTANLRDGANGFGFQPSWPMQVPWLFRIPIDHTLVSDGIQVINRKLGPDIESDHAPVLIEFQLAD